MPCLGRVLNNTIMKNTIEITNRVSELIAKHEFESFRGKDFQTELLVTPTLPQYKHKLPIPLRALFFDTSFEIELMSGSKLKKLFRLWNIPKGYQRHFVKTIEEQKSLLVALLRGEVDSQFIFGTDKMASYLDVIDSQQRLTILKKFFNNSLSLPKDAALKFIGHTEHKAIICGDMKFEDFKESEIYNFLMETILDGVMCETVVHAGPKKQHIQTFKSLNTGNTKLQAMEIVTAEQNEVMKFARQFNNFGYEIETDGDDWASVNKLWSLTTIGGLRYDLSKLVLQSVCFEYYGWRNITNQEFVDFSETQTITKSWKDIFEIFTKLHTEVIKEKKDYENETLWGLQGWRTFLSFLRFLYKDEEDSVKIVVQDYSKFWLFAQDLMKNLKTTLGYNDSTETWTFDDMKSQPKNNKKLVLGLVKEFDKVFSQHKTHQSFLDETGISVRDGKRAISFGIGSLVWQLQDGKCKECGTRISVRDDKDHNVEWAEGGKGDKDVNNIQLLCNSCHKDKTKNFVSNISNDDLEDDEK
mgnify:CR=1 FL=1